MMLNGICPTHRRLQSTHFSLGIIRYLSCALVLLIGNSKPSRQLSGSFSLVVLEKTSRAPYDNNLMNISNRRTDINTKPTDWYQAEIF